MSPSIEDTLGGGGQWEVVGRKDKQAVKNAKQSESKRAESRTYIGKDAGKGPSFFVVNEAKPVTPVKKQQPLKTSQNHASKANNKENKVPGQKTMPSNITSKKPPVKIKKHQSVESALNSINATDLKELIHSKLETNPDRPITWLTSIATYLHSHLSTVNFDDALLVDKPLNYPISDAPTEVKHLLEKIFREVGKQNAQQFFDNLLGLMVTEVGENRSAFAYKLLIQCCVLAYPQIVLNRLMKGATLRAVHSDRPHVVLAIFWAYANAAHKDFDIGLKVFETIIYPVIEMEGISKFAVGFLSKLISHFKNRSLSTENFAFLYSTINTKKLNAPIELLLELNTTLTTQIINTKSPAKYCELFGVVLKNLSGNNCCKKDACETLLSCLYADQNVYNYWKDIYYKNVIQSSEFLKYQVDNWPKISQKIDKEKMRELLSAFSSSYTTSAESFKGATQVDTSVYCRVLMTKMSGKVAKTAALSTLFFCVLVSTSLVLTYDYVHSLGWENSTTIAFSKQFGLYKHGEKAVEIGANAVQWVKGHCDELAPGRYDNVMVNYVEPAAKTTADLWLATFNALDSLRMKAVALWPVVVDEAKNYPKYWEKVVETSKSAFNITVEQSKKGAHYLRTEVFVGKMSPENLQTTVYGAFNVTKQYAVEVYQTIYKKIESTFK